VLAMYVQHVGLVIFGNAGCRGNLPICFYSSHQEKNTSWYGMVWYGTPLVLKCEEHC